MNIKFLGIVLVCVSYFSFQLTLVECSKETSDYYTHAGFGLAILQLPFALPFYALQAVTSNTGNWIRKGIRRVIRFNRKPVKKTSVAGSDVLEETPETVDDTQVLITEASIVDIAEPKTTESQDSISDRSPQDEADELLNNKPVSLSAVHQIGDQSEMARKYRYYGLKRLLGLHLL